MTYAAPAYALPTPLVISVVSQWCGFHGHFVHSNNTPTSQTGPAANLAIFVPFCVTTSATFRRGFWWNGSVPANAGNAAVGIYDQGGVRLATTGAVAAAGASIIQDAAFAASVALSAGTYYMAIEFSGAAGLNALTGWTASTTFRFDGAYVQAVGSHPLPANATFATWASNPMPAFGISQTSFAI